jgi:hypothetical protein
MKMDRATAFTALRLLTSAVTVLPASLLPLHAQQKAPPKGEPTNAKEAAAQKAAADKIVDEKYAAWGAKLTAARRAGLEITVPLLDGTAVPSRSGIPVEVEPPTANVGVGGSCATCSEAITGLAGTTALVVS